jgi:preprotein translocase SecE subunit
MSLRFPLHFLSTLSVLAATPKHFLKTWVQNAKQFYRDVRTEMYQVTWPDRREVEGTTVVVIIFIFVVGIYLFIVDELSLRAIGWIMRYFGATRPGPS